MNRKKLSLTEKISLAENNAVDFMHACVTIALHDEYEINEEMLEVMAQPRKSGREQAAAGRAWMVEASRKRVGCLPLAPAEVEKRIQTVLQAPAMPESWERRRAR